MLDQQMQNDDIGDEYDFNDAALEDIEEDVVEEAKADDEDDLTITIEGDEPEADPDADIESELGDRGKRAIKALREADKAKSAKLREAEAKIAQYEAEKAPRVVEVIRPTLEGCGFDADVFADKMLEYTEAQVVVKAKRLEEEARVKASDDDYKARFDRYNVAKATMRVDDFAAAEDTVRAALTREQQSVLIRNCIDPAKVVAALGQSKKALADIAAIKDIDRFAYQLATIEGKITVTSKTPPPPETKLRGGTTSAVNFNLTARLAAAEKKAETTKDRTEVQQIKRQAREAGIKY
jgi:hypothetical protein